MTVNEVLAVSAGSPKKRRPGPFGPASALLPVDQQVLTIPDDTVVADALERLVDSGFSQIPVTNADGIISGIFSWQSFGKRMSELHSANVNVVSLKVKDTDLEKARFVSPETYIDTATDWGQIDYVLVGSKDNLLGVLTISDVLGRLNDFAEAFVVLFEIEHEIRDLFMDVYPGQELSKVFAGLSERSSGPEVAAYKGLLALIEGDPPKITDEWQFQKVRNAVNILQKSSQPRPISNLEDFTFAQYREVIFNQTNWPRFEAVFQSPREVLSADFEKINELRNIVFHFRRGITPKDTDRLRRFREKLRYNRDLYNAKQDKANHMEEAARSIETP